jgi:hypothetical protein
MANFLGEIIGFSQAERARWLQRCALFFLLGGSAWLAGCQTTPAPPAVATAPVPPFFHTYARFYVESVGAGAEMMTMPITGLEMGVVNRAILTESDIVDAAAVQVDLGRCLRVKLTPAGARELARVTRENVGFHLVLTINDEPIGSRQIDGPMIDGTILIFVEVSDPVLNELAANLKLTSAEVQKEAKKK